MTPNDYTSDRNVQDEDKDSLRFTFVFDGSLPRDNWMYKGCVEPHGGTVARTVSEGTDYLVVGADPDQTELDKACEYDVPTLHEDDFLQLHRHLTS